MSERRKLTPEERECAAAFAQALTASAYIPESLAAALGVTPGAVGHWFRGEIVVPLKRVAKLASLIGVDPALISKEWADNIAPFLSAKSSLSPREAQLLANFANASEADKQSIERIADAMGGRRASEQKRVGNG